jgi:glycosyltransferase involved in cell wall biosynthesis
MSLRILHVTPYFEDAWGYGGIPRIATTLARELVGRGHSVTVCTTDAADADHRASGDRRSTAPSSDLDVRVFPNLSNGLAYHHQLFLPRGLNGFLARHGRQFDVAHLHACRNLPVSVAARHLRRAAVPYVLAPNGTAPRLERRHLAKWIYDHTLGHGDLEHATAVVAVTRAEEASLLLLGVPAARIRRIANPVDLDEHVSPPRRGAFRARFDLSEGRLLVAVGKLTPRKRVDTLIRALAAGVEPDVRLAIVGNDMGSLHQLRGLVAALGLTERVRFTGLLRGADRLEAVADADVLVHPAVDEIFGLAPLEALLAGTPVIVMDDSGAGEIVASVGGGLVVPRDDADVMAGAIRQVLAAPAVWRERAARAAAEVRRRFAGHVIAGELDGLYHEIARVH